jgi:hypothetical protein
MGNTRSLRPSSFSRARNASNSNLQWWLLTAVGARGCLLRRSRLRDWLLNPLVKFQAKHDPQEQHGRWQNFSTRTATSVEEASKCVIIGMKNDDSAMAVLISSSHSLP